MKKCEKVKNEKMWKTKIPKNVKKSEKQNFQPKKWTNFQKCENKFQKLYKKVRKSEKQEMKKWNHLKKVRKVKKWKNWKSEIRWKINGESQNDRLPWEILVPGPQ